MGGGGLREEMDSDRESAGGLKHVAWQDPEKHRVHWLRPIHPRAQLFDVLPPILLDDDETVDDGEDSDRFSMSSIILELGASALDRSLSVEEGVLFRGLAVRMTRCVDFLKLKVVKCY